MPPALPLHHEVLVRLGEIARRSDVIVESNATFSTTCGSWAKTLPADMMAFFKRLNGFWFQWRFVDEEHANHGPRLNTLNSDGKKLIHPIRRTFALGLTSVAKFPGGLTDAHGAPLPPTDKALLFEGEDSGYGVLARLPAAGGAEFLWWDNDGFTGHLTDSFEALIRGALESGFGYMWHKPEHPIVLGVKERLARPVPPRETFEVAVESREALASDLVNVVFAIRQLESGGLPLAEDDGPLLRSLHEHPGLRYTEGLPCDPRLVSVMYLPKLGLYTHADRGKFLERWKGRAGHKSARIALQMTPTEAEGLNAGFSFRSSALPCTIPG